MSNRRADLLMPGLLFVLALLFFGETLHPEGNELIFGYDLAALFRPAGHFAFDAFRRGQLPLWNPYLLLGFPQYAEPQLSTFYPPMWLAAWAPANSAFAMLYAFHFGLAAAGGYTLVRQLGGKWSGALLSGFCVAFMGFMVARVYAGHLPHIMTISYTPWLLAAAIWSIQPRFNRALTVAAASIAAGLPLGLAMLAGYAPFFPFLVVAAALLLLWFAGMAWQQGQRRRSLRIMVQLIALCLSGAWLAAVQLLPALEFLAHSTRMADSSYEFASGLSMPAWNLLRLLLPDLYGSPAGEGPYWAPVPENEYLELTIYAGVLPLILFALAWAHGRKPWRFWILLAVGGLLIALGPEAAIHRLLYQLLPGLGLLRVPARFGYFFGLAAAVLTGLLFDHWFRSGEADAMRTSKPLTTVLVAAVALFSSLTSVLVLWQAAQSEAWQVARLGGLISQYVRLMLLGAAALALLIWGRGRPRAHLVSAAFILLLVDLWGYGGRFIRLAPAEPELGWLMGHLALPPNRTEYRIMTRGLPENLGYLYGFYAVDGYDGFRLESSLRLRELAYSRRQVASLLSGRYLLVAGGERAPEDAGWSLLTRPAGVVIYEQQDVQMRAFVVHEVIATVSEEESLRMMQDSELDYGRTAIVQIVPDTSCRVEPGDPGASQVAITDYGSQQITIRVTTAVGGWLVLNDLYYPGWQATLDGRSVPIQPTNYSLRGVCLPAGSHEIVFEFRPPLLKVGAIATASAILLMGIAFLVLSADYHGRPRNRT